MRKSPGSCWNTSAGCSTDVAELPSPHLPLAVQLYTFRDPERFGGAGLGLDVPMLQAIADAGYLGVETVGVPGGDAHAARRVLADLGLAVASAHAWVDVADADAVARAAADLAALGSPRMIVSPRPPADAAEEIDVFADALSAAADRAGREGVRLGYHNHDTEMHSVDGRPVIEHLADRLGDAIDFQLDIFWVIVGGADPASVIERLGQRVVSLHVKDGIDLPSSAYADEPFVNVPVGSGVVDPAPAIAAAEAVRSVEWLIVEFDHVEGPGHRCRPAEPRLPDRAGHSPWARHVTTAVQPARVGIVGCGDATNLYLPGCAPFASIELAACADLDAERAVALSARGGFPAVSVDALLADPAIEIVLVLTPPLAHAAVSRAAIAAGKHVYSEKPLATTREEAAEILAEASAAGVRVGAAPDTFLGGSLQTARALIDEGAIGEPVVASATVAHLGPERWHPNPGIFYARGGGPLLDLGPYYVTALVSLLGPISSVSAVGRGVGSERLIESGPLAGGTVAAEVPTTVVSTLAFESGVVGGLIASFDVVESAAPHFEVHGTAGSLILGDPNRFDGEVRYRALGSDRWEDVPLRFDASVGRGIGLADLIDGIRSGERHRASGELAFHVLDILLSIESATSSGRVEAITSRCDRPAPLGAGPID